MSEPLVLNEPTDETGSPTAVGQTAVDQPEADAGPVCEKCGAPAGGVSTTVCPKCGWYASAGMHVEIAPEWEAAVASRDEAPAPQPSHLQVWLNLLPGWGWKLIGISASALAISAAVRLLVADEALRSTWSVTQLLVGLGVALASHIAAFVVMSTDSPDMGISDVVISPLRAWKLLLAQMPKRLPLVGAACFALGAAFGSVAIIGGIPYERLLDWGIKPPAKKNLIAAIAQAVPEGGGGDMSLEDSIRASAFGEATFGDEGGAAEEPEIQQTDAVILGYESDQQGKISTLRIAVERNGWLVYAGRVRPSLSPEENDELWDKFQRSRAPRPVVSAPEGAVWVKPRFTCRVRYTEQVKSGQLKGLEWVELLGEVPVP